MAKLSTPSHQCEQVYLTTDRGITPKCPQSAYRKVDGKWLCRTHGWQARERAARQAVKAG